MKRKKAADFATPLSDRFVNLGDDTTEEGLEFFEIKLETPSSDSDDDKLVELSTTGGDKTMSQVPFLNVTSPAVTKRGRGRPRKKRPAEGSSLGNSKKKVRNPTFNVKRGRPTKINGDRKPGSVLTGRLVTSAGPEPNNPGTNVGKDQVRMRHPPKRFEDNNEGQGTSRSFKQNGNKHLEGHYDSSESRGQGIRRKRGRPPKISQNFNGSMKNTNLSASLSPDPMISIGTSLSKIKSEIGQTLYDIKKRGPGRPKKIIGDRRPGSVSNGGLVTSAGSGPESNNPETNVAKDKVRMRRPPKRFEENNKGQGTSCSFQQNGNQHLEGHHYDSSQSRAQGIRRKRGRPPKISQHFNGNIGQTLHAVKKRGRGRPRKSINSTSSKKSIVAYSVDSDSDWTSSSKPAKKPKKLKSSRESKVKILDVSRGLILNISRCDTQGATLVPEKQRRRKRRFSASESLPVAAPANMKSEYCSDLPPKKRRGRPPKNTKITPTTSKGLPPSKKKINCSISDNTPLLEVCVDTIQSTINAVNGGAKRIELCSALSEGGLTPTVGLLELCKQITDVKIFAMIRPRCGDFLYSDNEIQIMERDIISLKNAGADGFVFGMLDELGNVDDEKCARLLAAANPLPCTFHRAFDLTCNPMSCLETIVNLGFDRILTSGLRPSAAEGIPLLKQLVDAANDRIVIMAGAGVNPGNVFEIVTNTGVKEVHGSGRVKVFSKMRSTSSEPQVGMGAPGEDDSSHFQTSVALVQGIVDQLTFAFKEIERLHSNRQNPEVLESSTTQNNGEYKFYDDGSKAGDVGSTEPPIMLTQLPEENNLENKEEAVTETATMIPASSHEPVEVGDDSVEDEDVIAEQRMLAQEQTVVNCENNNKITPEPDLSSPPQMIEIRDPESDEEDLIISDPDQVTSAHPDVPGASLSNLDESASGGNYLQVLNSSGNFNPESTGRQVLNDDDHDATVGSPIAEIPTANKNDTNNLQEVEEIGGGV